jgi:hypothetical protein
MLRQKSLFILPFLLVILLFSVWVMFHTFTVSVSNSQLLISAKAWSDFGSHLPLIRSFSYGANWPPQYPLYPGEPIRYHYLFYSVVGWLERLGVRIDYALNTPSALGLAGLACLIIVFSTRLFHSLFAGILSAILFFFNSSFSFLDFFARHPVSQDTLSDIIRNASFPSFGPWNGSLITAFWSLNIYTNQRHLGLSFAVALLLIYILYFSPRRLIYFSGFILGSLLLLNQAGFIIAAAFYFWFFIIKARIRRPLLVSSLGILPWIFISLTTQQISPQITFQPWYLAPAPHTLFSVLKFWFYNLGFNAVLIPLGFIFAPKKARKLILPALALFVIANIWKFSPDMINNHKFFNFFVIFGSMFTANLLIKLLRLKSVGIILFLIIIFSLVLGGIIDFFPVINDRYLSISDSPANPDVNYFLSLPRKSVVLNSFWFYHPASISGKSIYNGYSYFTWSYGYDQISRERSAISIYASSSKNQACKALKTAGISYIELSPNHETFVTPNYALWQNEFTPQYYNSNTGLTVYSVGKNCNTI